MLLNYEKSFQEVTKVWNVNSSVILQENPKIFIKLAWILVQYRRYTGPYDAWYYNCLDDIFNVKFSCIITAESIIC